MYSCVSVETTLVKRTFPMVGAILVAGSAIGACALRPVCVPLSTGDLAGFNSPIEARTDRDFYLRVFQHRDGQWQQCKTWLSRQLFF
jgi:hypothetical protein